MARIVPPMPDPRIFPPPWQGLAPPPRPGIAPVPGDRSRGMATQVPMPNGTNGRGGPWAAAARILGRENRADIEITCHPVRITATGPQELRLALDVLAFDLLDLELRVLRLEGASPSVTVEMQTAMQAESEEGWLSVAAFPAVTTAPRAELRSFTSLLRYVRWNVTALAGTGATFMIGGVGRWWA